MLVDSLWSFAAALCLAAVPTDVPAQIPDVTPAEVYKRVQAKDPKLVLVDVRQPAEQEVRYLTALLVHQDTITAQTHTSRHRSM